MLNEAENAMRKVEQVQTVSHKQPSRNSNVTAGEHLDAQRVFHRVLNSLPVGIAELSPEGIIVSANRHLLEITGYSLVDLFGKEACFLFERHRGNTLLMKHLTGSRGLISEARIRRQDRTGFLAAVVTKNMTVLPHDGLLLCIFDLSEVRLELNLD
jgi:PAS domain S-box-containing protein